MRISNKGFLLYRVLLFFVLTLGMVTVGRAQRLDTTALRLINITGDTLKGFQGDVAYQRVIGSVVITHEGSTMTCDSAHFYQNENRVEAFGHVQIVGRSGTRASGDYILYTGSDQNARMTGSVQIQDERNTLYTESVNYNLKTRIGKYDQGGTLQTEETTVSSGEGTYNVGNKVAYFKKDVLITHPKYTIESGELTYQTQTKVIKFLSPSRIMGETDTVITRGGVYDSKNEKAFFNQRTTLISKDQHVTADILEYEEQSGKGKATGHVVIEQEQGRQLVFADSMIYNKINGYAKATGQVELWDTLEHSRLESDRVEFNRYSGFMLATGYPHLITKLDNDSLYLRADTLLVMQAGDAPLLHYVKHSEGKGMNEKSAVVYNLLYSDSGFIHKDTLQQKLVMANHRVKVFSDSLQAVCDSLAYSQSDSTFRLFKQPVLWNTRHQAVADTIFLVTRMSKLQRAQLLSSAFLCSESARQLYDQVGGNFMDAWFRDNELQWVHVNQNAECVYYAKDESGAYVGMNRSASSQLDVYFEQKQIDHLVMKENPEGTFYPFDQIAAKDRQLDAFHLYTERRPVHREEIFERN